MNPTVDPLTAPNWRRCALLTIDVQNDFTNEDGAAPVVGTRETLPAIAHVLAHFRKLRLPVIHVVRLYAADGSDAEIGRRTFVRTCGPVVAPGTLGAEIVDALKPQATVRLDAANLRDGERQQIGPAEWIMYKSRWGAFYRTRLEQWLQESNSDTVVVCGCNFPNCPRATLTEASERDYRTVAVSDATSKADALGLAEVAAMGTTILSTAELCKQFTRAERLLETGDSDRSATCALADRSDTPRSVA